MYDAGIKSPPYPNAAHHIVPIHTEYCPTASDLLEEYGISKNAAVNGVFLPYKHNKYVTTESMHTGNHLTDYYKEVDRRFQKAREIIEKEKLNNSDARDYIVNVLQSIRADVMDGRLKTNKSK